MRYQSADGFVSRSHRHTFLDHVFHQRGGIQKSVFDASFDFVKLQFSPNDNGWCKFQRSVQRIIRREHRKLVFLQIPVVRQREALDQDQQLWHRTHYPRCAATNEFQNVRITLLRHDRGAGCISIRQTQKTKLRREPNDPFFGPCTQMSSDQG